MADTGLPFELPYPDPSSLVRNAPAAFEDLAEAVEDYLLYKETSERISNYTLALTDTNRVVPMNAAGTATVTVPPNSSVAFPLGSLVGVYNAGSATVTVVGGSGVTVRNASTVLQFQEISLRKRGTDEWVMV
jgi:hypothetical protein